MSTATATATATAIADPELQAAAAAWTWRSYPRRWLEVTDSSAVVRAAYDPEQHILYLEWKRRPGAPGAGDLYAYIGVDEDVWQRLTVADSIGSHAVKHVRPNRRFFIIRAPEVATNPGD